MKEQVGAPCSLDLLAGSLPNLFAQGEAPVPGRDPLKSVKFRQFSYF